MLRGRSRVHGRIYNIRPPLYILCNIRLPLYILCNIRPLLYILCNIRPPLYILCNMRSPLYILCNIRPPLYILCNIRPSLYILRDTFYKQSQLHQAHLRGSIVELQSLHQDSLNYLPYNGLQTPITIAHAMTFYKCKRQGHS